MTKAEKKELDKCAICCECLSDVTSQRDGIPKGQGKVRIHPSCLNVDDHTRNSLGFNELTAGYGLPIPFKDLGF